MLGKYFANPLQLYRQGILGMNRRNVHYISRYNPRHLYPRVDDKLQTKILARKRGVSVPELIGTIDSQAQLRHLSEMLGSNQGFCIKPAKGSGGKGILVIVKRDGDKFLKPSGEPLSLADLNRHVSNILAGLFSLGGKPDVAVIEQLIQFSSVFEGYSYEGVPDIRLIVFHGYPVMGMLRLSTQASDGKANLHQGAVGVGLDIASGKSVRAVQFDRPITHHPDTGKPLDQIAVPHWPRLLELASSCYEMAGLGYLGTDIVLDKARGPLLLELNARPGLAIQIANGCGLLPRLQHIEQLMIDEPFHTVRERIEYACQQFANHQVT